MFEEPYISVPAITETFSPNSIMAIEAHSINLRTVTNYGIIYSPTINNTVRSYENIIPIFTPHSALSWSLHGIDPP